MPGERYSFYKLIHKGLREVAHSLSARAGRTDFADPAQVEELQSAAAEAFSILETHAEQERRFVLPLLRRCAPQLAADSAAEHHAQALRLRDLRQSLALASRGGPAAETLGHAFVLGLSRFAGELFVHMADEEERQLPALWSAFDDDTLRRMHDALVASLSTEEKARTLAFVLPAIGVGERAALVADVCAQAPAQALPAVEHVLRRALPAAEWERLEADSRAVA